MNIETANPLYEFLELSRFVDEIDDVDLLEVGLHSIDAFEDRWAGRDALARSEIDLLRIELLMRLGHIEQAAPAIDAWNGDGETGLWLRCKLLESRGQEQQVVDLVNGTPVGTGSARVLQVVADALRRLQQEPGTGVLAHMRYLAKIKEVERFRPAATRAALDTLLSELSDANKSLSTLVEELDETSTTSQVNALVAQASGEIHVGAVRRQARSWLPVVQDLFDAIEDRDPARVERCLAGGARVDDEHADGSPLWTAAGVPGNGGVISVLLARGADPNALDEEGRTALLRAVGRGDLANVAALIEGGATVTPEVRSIANAAHDPELRSLLPSPAIP